MDLVEKFIKYSCEEVDNYVSVDGITPIAPPEGSLRTLWDSFLGCMEEIEVPKNKIPSRKLFKTVLIEWQKKSKYGCELGVRDSDNKINGTLRSPKFNLNCHFNHTASDFKDEPQEPQNPNLPNYNPSPEELLIAQIKYLETQNQKLKNKNEKFQKMIKVLLED